MHQLDTIFYQKLTLMLMIGVRFLLNKLYTDRKKTIGN